jgi:hypothetical protein
MDIKEQIRVALGLSKAQKFTWQSKSEDGTIFVSTADELAAGVDVSVLTEDGTTIPLPIGTYKTEAGVTFRVEAEGVVAEVLETETEETVTVDEEVEMGEDTGTDDDEVKADDWAGMEKRVKNLEDAIADLKARIGGDSVEMADEEATEEVVTEVVEEVEKAVEEIAAAIDDATPEEVTPELATKAAEVAIEVMQEKAEDVAEASEGKTEEDMKKKKKEYSKLSKLEKENKELKEKLNSTPAGSPINTNKFSSDTKRVLSKKEYNKLSKTERFLYNLNKY